MGGLLRTFALFGAAGLGWTVGRRAGENLWTRIQERYPGLPDQLKKAVDQFLEPVVKATRKAETPPGPEAGETEGPPPAGD